MFKRCEICKIDIQDEPTWLSHIAGKKHKKNEKFFKSQQSTFEKSLFVTNLPHKASEKELYQFFSQFDRILKFNLQPKHLIIDFESGGTVQYLLNNPITLFNTRLKIRRRILKQDFKNSQTPKLLRPHTDYINGTEELAYNNIKSIFEISSTFDEQLSEFLQKVEVTEVEIHQRYLFTCRKLEEVFRRFINSYCTIHRFGSTVTGLGFKNCDLDIYLDLGNWTGTMTPSALFFDVKRLLYAKQYLFKNIVPIPKAKTPIIKFNFLQKNISCDISFKNSLAVHNSKLLKFYLDLDPRWRPTMMILKYWLSKYELSSSNKMSKYSLTLLFIFFLQQPNVKLVPPIIDLKRRCEPQFVEGWQVNFDEKKKDFDQSGSDYKNKSIPEILHGFFKFYANYDFSTYVICPIDGMSHPRGIFTEVNQIPESMNFYKKYLETTADPFYFPEKKRVMCIQDPNELNHNITAGISEGYLEVFQKYCRAITEFFVTESEKDYKTLLPSLFELYIQVNQPRKLVGMFKIFSGKFLQVGVPKDIELKNKGQQAYFVRIHWYSLVKKLIKTYLEKVLKIQIETAKSQNSESPELKQQKIEENSDVHSNRQSASTLINCKSNICLWKNRQNYQLNVLDPSTSLLEKEIQVTENMLSGTTDYQVEFENLEFTCEIIEKKGPICVIVNLKCHDKDKGIFVEFVKFLVDNLPKTVTKTLEHMKQFDKDIIE